MISGPKLFHGIWESIANRGRDLLAKRLVVPETPLIPMCRELLTERGEASGMALGLEIAVRYQRLTAAQTEGFFQSLLGKEFLPEPAIVNAAAEDYREHPGSETLATLVAAAEPLRQELFRRINLAPGGTGILIAMRSDLLRLLPTHPELKPIDADLRHLLASWFNRGFLHVGRIDWKTPAMVLEKLIEYEAVHEIEGWDDLRRRLADDRRCFAFFHPLLPQQPLIFIEIALTHGTASSIQKLLDRSPKTQLPADADTATFYSISNCLEGLRGISFGNFLIKQVIAELKTEGLKIRTFETLSPMPGFREWWKRLPEKRRDTLATAREQDFLQALEARDWHQNAQLCAFVKPVLLRLGAQYLMRERAGGRTLDAVAAFHLGNGAAVERLHFLGDRSEKGMSRSFGLMVNYSYRSSRLERNHEDYVKHGRIAASSEIKALLQKASLGSPSVQEK
jgi:malonyl-CoA decarboxylase